jgi:FHS family glucose/mannose:H+ symporter-like MFS transporter
VQPSAKAWQILFGLVISGFLLALPGGLLPLWGYHISPEFGTAGNYFLVLGAGIVCGGALALRLSRRISLQRLLAAGYFTAALSLVLLSVAAPPAQVWYQSLALLVTGIAAGVVNTAVLEGLTGCYDSNPATITLRGGIFFGGGSVIAAFLLAQSFGNGGGTRLLAIAALIPGLAGIAAARLRIAGNVSESRSRPEVSLAQSMQDLRSPLAIMFALLLFFQFANEWSIAGWLPVFLIDRLGLSPATAVTLLGWYWLALMVGRLIASRLLRFVRHGRLLGGSAFGVVVGLLLTGVGFSAIYPLVAERIASRFTYYHPGYFNGIFTFALTGGILAPFVIGHLVAYAGLKMIPLAAMLGSCAVFGLALLIWLGRKVSGQ